ncbi:hypothetical protein CSOJ01_15342 [Colletotrichum sojae]|uniref:Uncharacterized protein n=1 Tax=Colletotrichum sojae TaxID=2175907 RepID=A0A8H6IND0_9PEZI|nr:hypothetical protein CSOJ01_15342 [Colletotrichum sojae]
MDFILEPRKGGGGKSSKSSKSKSKSSKKYKGGSRVGGVGGGGAGGGGGGGFNTLPVWARVLIIVLIIWFVIFLIALTYYVKQEWQRKREGKKFRLGHALGNALLVSTGLWLPVFIYKKIAARRAGDSGTYAKIEEGHGKEGAGNHDSWYGGAGAGNETKYDPGNPPAYRPQTPNPPAPAPAPAPQTGAAADYYMPTPPSNTAPAQHPPQYA